jgi:hypothetical protein
MRSVTASCCSMVSVDHHARNSSVTSTSHIRRCHDRETGAHSRRGRWKTDRSEHPSSATSRRQIGQTPSGHQMHKKRESRKRSDVGAVPAARPVPGIEPLHNAMRTDHFLFRSRRVPRGVLFERGPFARAVKRGKLCDSTSNITIVGLCGPQRRGPGPVLSHGRTGATHPH